MTSVIVAPSTESLQSWARLYAASGFSPLPLCPPTCPCQSPGKNPHRTGWNTSPPTLDTALGELAAPHNLGVVIPTSFMVIDVDAHTPKANGEASLRRLQQDIGLLPDTPRSVTGGGGQHIWLTLPAGWEPLTSAQHLTKYPGLDFLFGGRQVVEAPSVHASGGPYRWLTGYEPGGKAFAEAPAALLALFNSISQAPIIAASGPVVVRTDRRMSARVRRFVAGQVGPGSQDNEAWACAVSLRASGFDEDEVAALLWEGMQRLPAAGRAWVYDDDAADMARRAFKGPLPPMLPRQTPDAPTSNGCHEEVQPHVVTLPDLFRSNPAAVAWWEQVTDDDETTDDLSVADRDAFEAANLGISGETTQFRSLSGYIPLAPGATPEDYRARARERFPVPKGVKPSMVTKAIRRKAKPTEITTKGVLSNAHYNPYNFAVQQSILFAHFLQLMLEDGSVIWRLEVAFEDFDSKKRTNMQGWVKRRGGDCVWFDNAERARAFVLYATREVPGSVPVPQNEIEERLGETIDRLARPPISNGQRSAHWFSSTRAWALIRRAKNDDASKYELVGTRDGEADTEAEEAIAAKMGFDSTYGPCLTDDPLEVGRRRIYTLRPERAAELTRRDPDGAAREACYFVQRCGYRLTLEAYREVYGVDPQWYTEFQARRARKKKTPAV